MSIKITRSLENGGTVTIEVDGSSSVSNVTIGGIEVLGGIEVTQRETWWTRFKRWFKGLFR